MLVVKRISYLLVSLMLLHSLFDVLAAISSEINNPFSNVAVQAQEDFDFDIRVSEFVDLRTTRIDNIILDVRYPSLFSAQRPVEQNQPCADCLNGGCCHFCIQTNSILTNNNKMSQVLLEHLTSEVSLFISVSLRPPIV